jgi:hypothetical protein
MSISDYGEAYWLDIMLEANLWVGLSTADPGDDGATLAEPSGNGYARVAVTASTWAAAASPGGTKTNETVITFPEASGSWGTVSHICLFDAATSGHLLWSGALDSSEAVTTGNIARFSASALTFTLA